MKARKYIISIVVLGVILCLIFVQLAWSSSVEPVRAVATPPRGLDFQKKIERYFSANGHLLMPLGFYGASSYIYDTNQMKHLVQNGITFIHKYDSKLTVETSRKDVESTGKAGIALALNLHSRPVYLSAESSWWENYLRSFLDEKQIVIWYLPEEPELKDLPKLRELAELVHKLDKNGRPVMTYLKNGSQTMLTQASEFLDCVVYGAYPGPNTGVPRIRIAYKIDTLYDSGAPAVMAALEAFKNKTGWVDPKHIEFDAYLSLLHSARGIWWYCYYWAYKNPQLLDAVLEVSKALNGPEHLGEVFLKGQDNTNVTAQILSGPTRFPDGFVKSMRMYLQGKTYPSVQWRAYNHLGNVYLVMVNCCQVMDEKDTDETSLTVRVQFAGFGSNNKITLLDGESEYTYQAGLLTVMLKPLGVAVFKIAP